MPPTDDSLPFDDPDFELEVVDDESLDADDADEEMSGAPESDEPSDDPDEAPGDDSEDADDSDTESAELRRQLTELQARERRMAYEEQQRRNQAYWVDIETQAEQYFAWKKEQIYQAATDYVDPDLFVRTKRDELDYERAQWFRDFFASQNEARRQQYERAAVPAYAARVATHYQLSDEQERELLDYPPDRMPKEAEKMARYNAREASLRTQSQQAQRKRTRDGRFATGAPTTGGSGRGSIVKVKRGSDEQLFGILAKAAHGR